MNITHHPLCLESYSAQGFAPFAKQASFMPLCSPGTVDREIFAHKFFSSPVHTDKTWMTTKFNPYMLSSSISQYSHSLVSPAFSNSAVLQLAAPWQACFAVSAWRVELYIQGPHFSCYLLYLLVGFSDCLGRYGWWERSFRIRKTTDRLHIMQQNHLHFRTCGRTGSVVHVFDGKNSRAYFSTLYSTSENFLATKISQSTVYGGYIIILRIYHPWI